MSSKIQSFAVLGTLLLSACASTSVPVVPPTELNRIKVEAKVDRLWKQKLEKSAKGNFQPLVQDGVVYAASRGGEIIAIDQATGKRKWSRQLAVTLSSGIGGENDQLYVSSADGLVIALSATDGSFIWETQASSEVLAAVSAGFGAVIVRSADGRMLSLDPETGDELWSSTYTPPALTINGYSSPLLVDGGVLIGLEDGRLLALRLDNGNVLWESVVSVVTGRSEVERLADLDGRLGIDDEAIYAVNFQGRLARIEPAKGQIIWSVPMSSTAGLGLSGSAVFVVVDDDEVQAFDKETGTLLWSQVKLKNRHLSAPHAINEDLVLVGDVEGYLHILDSSDGRLVGRTRPARRSIYPHISSSDGTFVVQASDGTVAAFRHQP